MTNLPKKSQDDVVPKIPFTFNIPSDVSTFRISLAEARAFSVPVPVSIPNSTQATPGDSISLVIAIDFGTSRSGFAYAFVENKTKIEGHTRWEEQLAPYYKTITHILYSPERKVIAWGWKALKKHIGSRNTQDKPFSNFKMLLYEGQDKTKDGPYFTTQEGERVRDTNGQGFLVLDLIADYLRELKDYALQNITSGVTGLLEERQIRWCLTVPAIWTNANKQLMRRAAQKAGLVGSSKDDGERLVIVLEPEAAAIHCIKHDKGTKISTLDQGKCFMVVDCGGGTVDITVHEIAEHEELKEVVPPEGGNYGSTYIDQYFFKTYLPKKLAKEVIETFRKQDDSDYLRMRRDWELAKCGFNPNNNWNTLIPLGNLYKILRDQHSQVLQDLREQQNGEDMNIVLTPQEMEVAFSYTIKGTILKIEEQLNKLGSRNCDIIFLVGGYAESPLLQQRIKEKFETKVRRVITPSSPGFAVLSGAVYFGLEPRVIRSRCSRFTYGCGMSTEFDPKLDPETKKFWHTERKVDYCHQRFKVFVTAGDSVSIDNKITHIFSAHSSNQTKSYFPIYTTPNKEVRYTDEDGVKKVGEIEVNMPDTTGGINRKIKITMYFGRTEIEVEARDETSGNENRVKIDFSYE